MQIVSEAPIQYLKQTPILHASTHNRIAFVTHNYLTVRQITLQAKRHYLKLKGHQVTSISLENFNFIVILYCSGHIQVRKVDCLTQVLVSCQVNLPKNIPHKIRVSSQAVYVLGKDCIESINLMKQKGRSKIFLEQAKQEPKDFLISSIFEQQIILIQYPSSIALTTEGRNIAEAPFEEVSTFKLLKNPLVLSNQSKQFLVLIQSRKYLKVFDIFDLEPILQMQLILQQNEQIELKVDPLYEYLLMRYYNFQNNETTRNNLLRINKDFYQGSAKQPFFLFDIEIGLKQDFILFPTHIEEIKGSYFYSIDMCFFTLKEIRIATLVVDVDHRTKLTNASYVNSSWKSHSSWSDFFFNKKEEEQEGRQTQIQYQEGYKEDDWEIFLEKFYKENLQKLKCQNIYKFNNKNAIQYQDALNTLSGSSSFESLKEEIPSKLALPYGRKHFQEEDHFSEEHSWREKEKQKDKQEDEVEQFQRDEYLQEVQEQTLEVLAPIDEKIDKIDQRLDRFQNVHERKLRNISKQIKRHRKQTQCIDKNIQQWCQQQLMNFGSDIKESLKQYNAMVGRLQIIQIRAVKRLKKHYKDSLELQVERCYEKLEQGQKVATDIQRIATKSAQR